MILVAAAATNISGFQSGSDCVVYAKFMPLVVWEASVMFVYFWGLRVAAS
jgi:hypothetical protein